MDFSILIGLVSTEDSERIFEMLASLRKQTGLQKYEVIIADRRNDQHSHRLDKEFAEVTLIPCPPSTSLPKLRTLALDRAVGNYIVVTEDHVVPAANWLESMAQAFKSAPEGTVAVGGCVENGVYKLAFDWATFLCEYCYFPEPVEQGVTNVLPGMNIAYRHSVFDDIDRELLINGFWETTLHPVLLKKGNKFFSSNAIKLYHCKKFSFKLFVEQRFIYSRYYAGLRFERTQRLKRITACILTLLLPPVLLFRCMKQIGRKKRLKKELYTAMPYLLVFYSVWALGEMAGYLFGQGDALSQIE